MSNTERQLRQTIDEQDKEICLLKDQLNRLTEINNNLWNLFIEQSKQIKMLNNLNPISNELERNERNKKRQGSICHDEQVAYRLGEC